MNEISIVVKTREERTAFILKVEEAVRKMWDSRAKTQGFKAGSKKYNELRAEFMLGMVGAMDSILKADETNESSITPRLYFELTLGR